MVTTIKSLNFFSGVYLKHRRIFLTKLEKEIKRPGDFKGRGEKVISRAVLALAVVWKKPPTLKNSPSYKPLGTNLKKVRLRYK
ncbi:hypothetical protein BY996DRAFT_6555401 [Phakopsora pachyrhizi]|nr:hypothetical protein BY996DRAFT_6555401 [Phakopsora pachyrhizi]